MKKLVVSFICAILVVLLGILIYFFLFKETKKQTTHTIKKEVVILDNYSEYVKVSKSANIYNQKQEKVGFISKDTTLKLDDKSKSIDNKYYKLYGDETYIKAKDVEKDSLPVYENNEYKFYKNYIVYNENIVTNDTYKMYFYDNNYIELKSSKEYPIIVKEEDKYGIEYNDSLVYVNASDVKEIKESNNTELEKASGVAVLNYHYTIDENSDERKECRQSICMTQTQVEEEIKYLKDNEFYATTMRDMYLYLTNKIQLPSKSVTITIDDGWYVARMKNILEKYEMMGTLYLIGSLASPNDYQSDYLEIHSHSWDLHKPNECRGSHGGGLLCKDESIILEGLKKSRESLNNTEVFCYPFYEYNDRAINLLKQAGFKMAFAGGYKKAMVGDNLYTIPRYELGSYTTLNDFIEIVN